MRDLLKGLSELENRLEETYETVTAGTIISCTGLTSSHASKVIRSVEDKGLLARKLGEQDKRQMYFTLTRKGKNCLERIKEQGVEVPEWLAPLFL